jgi:flagellar hook-associated protein 3 FlgL
MRISTTSFTDNFLPQINQLAQQQNTLQNEASTGLKVSLPEDNPEVMGQVLNLQADASATSQYQNNITSLQATATNSAAAMNSLKTISDRIGEISTLASSGTNSPTQLTSYATEVGQLLQHAVQIGNTKDADGNYIFGGTANNVPPFQATTAADGTITAVTYQGNASVSQSEIAPNMTVTAQAPGANATGSGPRGLFSDSRYGADFFSHLVSLQTDLTSGNTSAISSTDAPAVTKDEDNIISAISANGVLQSTLTNANNVAAARATNITTRISSQTSADLATTLTQLSQAQTAYQAALESGTKIMSLSLLDYLQ